MEHTVLRPEATRAEIESALADAARWKCHGICLHPYWVPLAARTPLRVITVVSFPFGAEPAETKVESARRSSGEGASEIDMVMNVGALLSGEVAVIAREVEAVRRAIPGRTLKVILETGMLTAAQTREAARICAAAGADFLKTSTGYGPRGATVEDVIALRPFGHVKASGGIRTFAQAAALIDAGAERLGCSRTGEILAACA